MVLCVTSALTCRLSSRLHARRKDSPILSPLIPIGEGGQVCMLELLAHLALHLLSCCHSLRQPRVLFLEQHVECTSCCLAIC